MFRCKVCDEKSKRIQDLQSQIAFLRTQVSIDNNPNTLPTVHLEADAVLSAQQHVTHIESSELTPEQEDELSERNRILAGTY